MTEKSEEVSRRSSLKHEHSEDESYRRQRTVHFSNELTTADLDALFVNSLEKMGKCSLWIMLMLTLSSWISIIISLQNSLFIATTVINFTCYIDDIPTFRGSTWNFEMKKNISIPVTNGTLEQCFVYDMDYSQLSKSPYRQALAYVEENRENFKIKACSQAVSNDIYFFDSFTFVDVHLHSLCTQHIQRYIWVSGLCGRLLTDIPMGIAADIYGRRCIIQITTLICFLGLLIVLLSKNAWSLLIGRIIAGSGGYTSFLIFYLYFTELCSKDSRTVLCQIVFMGWGVGYITAVVLLYSVKHLWYLHFSVMALMLVCFFGIWYIPESPRWLLSQKRYKNVWKIINDIYSMQLEENEVLQLPTKPSTIKQQLNIFKRSALGNRISKSTLMCAASLLAYYTAQKKAIHLDIDLYNYLVIFSLISLLHPLIAIALINFLGKRLSITFVYAILSVLYCSTATYKSVHTTLFVLFINFSTLANHLTIAYTVEMYPVAFSGTILGFCTSFGTLVVILQEILESYMHVKLLKHIWYIMFTGTAMVIVYFLPETSGKVLPLTMHSAKMLK